MNDCPACGAQRFVAWIKSTNRHGRHLQQPAQEFQLVRCASCGLLRVAGVVVDADYYRRFYVRGYHRDGDESFRPLTAVWAILAALLIRRKLRLLRRYAPRRNGKMMLLDVGCGTGGFLSALPAKGFEAHGLEPVHEAVTTACGRGLNVKQGDIMTAPLGENIYDAVTLWHVLEHLNDPAAALSRIRDALAEGGIVVIATPNTDSLACRLGKERWYHLDTPRHLNLFNRYNLKLLLQRCGFEVAHESTMPFDYPLDFLWSICHRWYLWPLLPLYPLLKPLDRQNMLLMARKRQAD